MIPKDDIVVVTYSVNTNYKVLLSNIMQYNLCPKFCVC